MHVEALNVYGSWARIPQGERFYAYGQRIPQGEQFCASWLAYPEGTAILLRT